MSAVDWPKRLLTLVRREWRELGGLGRAGWLGIGAALVVAIALGFSITNNARSHLLEARTDLLSNVAAELATQVPNPPAVGSADYARFDVEVRLRLLGGETVRVKLWTEDGAIAYSDAAELVGRTFELSAPARAAFVGTASSQISDLADPAHEADRDLGELIEFYIPYGGEPGTPVAVFEVEQRVDSLNRALGRINRNVWISIGGGIAALAVFLGALLVSRARDLNRRRRQAERLLGSLLEAQEVERRQVIGALHDDIGQPLYRLLYGLEGSRAKLPPDHAAARELQRLEQVVREVDDALRAELRILHEGVLSEVGLGPALEDLASAVQTESGLEMELHVDLAVEPDPVPRAALYRAAREAITNTRKHAGARRVVVRVVGDAERVTLTVADNGTGARGEPGLGLTTTRERLEIIGGGAKLESRRGTGTTFEAWAPPQGGE